MYESLIDLENGVPQTLFVPLTYTLASEEAERIGVDHVVRMSSSEVGDKSIRKMSNPHYRTNILYCVYMIFAYAFSIRKSDRAVPCY